MRRSAREVLTVWKGGVSGELLSVAGRYEFKIVRSVEAWVGVQRKSDFVAARAFVGNPRLQGTVSGRNEGPYGTVDVGGPEMLQSGLSQQEGAIICLITTPSINARTCTLVSALIEVLVP